MKMLRAFATLMQVEIEICMNGTMVERSIWENFGMELRLEVEDELELWGFSPKSQALFFSELDMQRYNALR